MELTIEPTASMHRNRNFAKLDAIVSFRERAGKFISRIFGEKRCFPIPGGQYLSPMSHSTFLESFPVCSLLLR